VGVPEIVKRALARKHFGGKRHLVSVTSAPAARRGVKLAAASWPAAAIALDARRQETDSTHLVADFRFQGLFPLRIY